MVRFLKPFIFAICIMTISSCGFNWIKGSLYPSNLETITTAPLPAITLSFTMPEEVAVADCSAVSVELSRPVAAEDMAVAEAASVDLSEVSTNGNFYSDSNCVNRMNALDLSVGMEDMSFYYKANTAGTDLIIIAFGEDSYEYSVIVDKLGISLSSVAENVIVDQCSEVRVAFSKAPENAFNLVPTADNGFFYSDADCTHNITSIPVAAGASNVVFYIKAALDRNINFSLAPSTVNYPTLTHELTVNPSLMLGGTGSEAYSCVPLTVALSRAASEDVAVTFTVDSATSGHIYSDGVCAVPASSTTIPTGDTSKIVYFMASTPETHSIDAVTETHGSVYSYAVEAGQKDISVTIPAGIQNQCIHGTVDLAVSAPVTFHVIPSVTSGTAGFYSDAGCTTSLTTITMAEGLPQAGFYVKSTADANATLKFSPDNSAYSDLTKTLTINPHISASFADALVFDCVTVTTTLTRSVGQNIAVALGGADGTHYSNSSCTSVITSATITSGATSVVTYYSSTLAGTHLLTFDAGAYGSDSKSIVMSKIALTLNGPASVVGNTTCGLMEIKITSGALAKENVTGTLSVTSGGFYSNSGCTVSITQVTISTGQNNQLFYYKAGVVGHTQTATASLVPASANYTAPTNLDITVTPAPGSLDDTFGAAGTGIVSVGSMYYAKIVLVQPDGKILVATSSSGWSIYRYNTNGVLDTTFGTNGVVSVAPQRGTSNIRMLLQPDGKILLGGLYGPIFGGYYVDSFIIYRFNANGSTDTSFGTNGIVKDNVYISPITSAGTNSILSGTMLLQPDGKILAVGTYTGASVMRFNANGSVDTAFGGAGTGLATNIGGGTTYGYAKAAALQSDGKIVVLLNNVINATVVAVARLNTDGTLDTTYGTSGVLIIPSRNMYYFYYAGMAVQSDDKMIISTGSAAPPYSSGFIARITTTGTMDTTFATTGSRYQLHTANLYWYGGFDHVSVVVASDGKIFVPGRNHSYTTGVDTATIAKYNADGSADTTWGTGGLLTITQLTSPTALDTVAIQSDGKILVGGTNTGVLIRLNP